MEETKIKTDGDGIMKKAGHFIDKEKEMIRNKIEEQKAAGPFTPEKLVGVAFLGAFAGLLAYYVYYTMPYETRQSLTNKVKSSARKYASEVFPALMQQGSQQ